MITGSRRHFSMIVLLLLAQPFSTCAELLEDLTITHDGEMRVYDLYRPSSGGGQPAPLVLDLHGFTLTKESQRGFSGFEALAEREEFFVAWPNGLLTAWNSRIGFDGADDVGFLRALVARIGSEYDIDPDRIYATGHSMGGGMVYRLACEAADLFAAFSVIAMTIHHSDAANCDPVRPVPVLSFNGLSDTVAPYDGDGARISAPDTLEHWRNMSNCNGPAERRELGVGGWCDTYLNCGDGVEVVSCAVTGDEGAGSGGHLVYSNTAGLDLAEKSWDFFRSFTLAGGSAGFRINAGLNDAWVSADAPLQGFFFTVFPDTGFFFLSWFTFDSLPHTGGAAVFGAADQRWVTGGGAYAGNSVTVSVELTSGGIFDAPDPKAIQQAGYGTITVTFIDCNRAELSYDFPAAGLAGDMTLSRAVTDNVALCEALQGNEIGQTGMR